MQNFSLQKYNTFGIEAYTTQLFILKSEADLLAVLQKNVEQKEIFILGGGSNILLTGDVKKWVLKNEIKGKSIDELEGGEALVTVGGGENWHEFVVWCLQNDLGGLENLSLIPGTVGASPIQNIGAYGVELKDVFYSLSAIHLKTGKKQIFYTKDCAFGYRQSIFKQELKGQYCITSVTFKLTNKSHKINIAYGAIQAVLTAGEIEHPDIQNVHEAVVQIRQQKLPDPKVLGNAGSFFKNPEVSIAVFEKIEQGFPTMPSYPGQTSTKIKIPAGWLIEQCGWKGKRHGNTGCYEKQALILVNYGGATGEEVKNLAKKIIESVKNKFGVDLEMEVNLI